MILVPLLGIQFIFFSSMPDENHSFKKVYQVLVALINSLQGFFLALLFCFLNGEVIQLLKRRAHTRSQQKSLRRRSSAHNSAICTAVSFPLNDIPPQQQQRAAIINNSNNSSSKSRASQSSARKFRSPPKRQSNSLDDDDDKRRRSSDYSDCNRRPLLKPTKVGLGRAKRGNIVSFNGAVNSGEELDNSTRIGDSKKNLKNPLTTPSVDPPESARSF